MHDAVYGEDVKVPAVSSPQSPHILLNLWQVAAEYGALLPVQMRDG
jgi:hypothetical protein